MAFSPRTLLSANLLQKAILKQPVREETCRHTASSFILVWFSCFTAWLSQSFLIHSLKAEFGDSKVFWGCLGDTVRLLAQTYKPQHLHYQTPTRLARYCSPTHGLWRTGQLQSNMLTGTRGIHWANGNIFWIMPGFRSQDFCQKGCGNGTERFQLFFFFFLKINLNNAKYSRYPNIWKEFL